MAFRDLMTNDVLESDIILVGIPYDKSTSIGSGASKYPDLCRKLSEYLPPYTVNMNDLKPLKIYDEGNFYLKKNINSYDALSKALEYILKMEKFTFFLGGDHSVSISTEKAFISEAKRLNKIPVLFHLDAHADICDFYDGSKLSHATPVKRMIDNGIDTNNVCLFGIRSYEDQETKYLSLRKEIKVFNSNDINTNIEEVFKYIDKFRDDKYMVHVSFDIDMVDPSFAPGTGTPEHFGVLSAKALELLSYMIKNFNVNTFDLVEVSPKLDVNDITTWLSLKIIYELLFIIKEKKNI